VKIQILGTCCPKCRETTSRVEQAVAELGIEADVEKIEKIQDIMVFGVMATPAIVVDGTVRVSGRLASLDEIKTLLTGES